MTVREDRPFVVYGFGSTHAALAAERELKDAGVAVVAIPSPRVLGELCGIALRVEVARADEADDVLSAAGLAPAARAEMRDI